MKNSLLIEHRFDTREEALKFIKKTDRSDVASTNPFLLSMLLSLGMFVFICFIGYQNSKEKTQPKHKPKTSVVRSNINNNIKAFYGYKLGLIAEARKKEVVSTVTPINWKHTKGYFIKNELRTR